MAEIRQDPFTNRMVIIAKERAKRPMDLANIHKEEVVSLQHNCNCFFCLGNEHTTPEEVERIEKNGEWQVRVVPNKFPILSSEFSTEGKEAFYNSATGYGFHEVVIENNRHNGSFFNMNEEEFQNYILVLKRRYVHLKNESNVKYISMFKNYLKGAGASLEHPHSQVLTVPIIPSDIEKELKSARKYFYKNGHCLHDSIIQHERETGDRIIHEGKHFVVLAPYASFYNNEIEVIYKENKKFEELNSFEEKELASILERLFKDMYTILGEFPFNMYFHTHPVDEAQTEMYKWHIHITPRLSCQAGFELSTGIHVNAVTPESVAGLLSW